MLKKLLKYCSFKILNNWELGSRKWSRLIGITSYFLLLTFYFLGCAPRIAPPPLYKDMDLSLEEIITIAKGEINSLKAIVNINIEKDDMLYSNVDASLLLKRPNWLHMRLYRFGIIVGDFLIKDNVVHTASGKGAHRFREFGRELYYSVFWWEDIEDALMYKQPAAYVIRTKNKEIRINRSTLLPESQEIAVNSRKIHILYDEPQREVDLWYPSLIKIEMGVYRLTVKVTKLFINPPLEEDDFPASPILFLIQD